MLLLDALVCVYVLGFFGWIFFCGLKHQNEWDDWGVNAFAAPLWPAAGLFMLGKHIGEKYYDVRR